jgi:hypothetical protein
MAITIETAKTNRVACRSCGRRILKDTQKAIIHEKGFNGYEIKKSYCFSCIKPIILDRIKELEEMLKVIEGTKREDGTIPQ